LIGTHTAQLRDGRSYTGPIMVTEGDTRVIDPEFDEYGFYLLDQLTALWTTFASEFSRLWHELSSLAYGSLCNARMNLDSPAFSAQALAWRLEQIWHDSLGFAGCEMIRRIMGLAHVADFEVIIDPDRRAECERRAIFLARGLLMERSRCRCISVLSTLARSCE
jgi:5-methylthioribose kinase